MWPNTEVTRDVWRHYVVNHAIPDRVLRAPIERAWHRCDEAGASPHIMMASTLSSRESQTLFVQEHDFVEAARPYMEALSQAAGNERHAAMLGNANAVVLDVIGDEDSVHGPQRVPGPGARLSEAFAGANGIGSPLAEGGYIELVGPEHFIEGFHPFTCQGLPITGPAGETIGVVSTSVRRVEASRQIREILISATHGIEAELVKRRLEGDLARYIANTAERPLLETVLLEGIWEDVVQLQGAARLWLERAIRRVRSNRDEDAARLLYAINELIQTFQRKSVLWREIASNEKGPPRHSDLREKAEEIAALFHREALLRGIEIELLPGPPVQVYESPQELLRATFRAFLTALEAMPDKASLRGEIISDKANKIGLLRFPNVPEAFVASPLEPSINLAEISELAH